MRKRLTLCSLVTLGLLAPPAIGPSVAAVLDEDLIVSGKVVRQNDATPDIIGKRDDGAIAGAQVVLRWTPDEDLVPDDGDVATVVVAKAVTSSDGTYALAAAPTASMVAAARRWDGWLNFDLWVRSPRGDTTITGISRAIDAAGQWTGRDIEEFMPTAPLKTTLAFNTAGAMINGEAGNGTVGPLDVPCGYRVLRRWVPGSTRFLNFHNASNAIGTWTYGKTAESDVEMAYKYGTDDWSVSGSHRVSNSSDSTMTGSTGNYYHKWVRTWFQYERGQYYGDCGSHQKAFARLWTGGAEDDGDTYLSCRSQPRLTYRRPFPRGQTFTVSSSRASKVGFAIDLKGISHLGNTSGYSTRVSLHWNMNQGPVYLCGQKDFLGAGETPGVIYADNR